MKSAILNALLILLLTACSANSSKFDPRIEYYPPESLIVRLPSPFPPLSQTDIETSWGKELYLGLKFVAEEDYYRGITCFKSALFLAPEERRLECEYRLLEAYYLAGKYEEAIRIYEKGCLGSVPLEFCALKELLLMLADSYERIGFNAKAERVRCLLEMRFPETAEDFSTYQAVKEADFCSLNCKAQDDDCLALFLANFAQEAKSPQKARLYNALLPGAGYLYLGQKQSALTSFLINTLFTWAAYRFFERGYPAAGLITASLETGWYFGGIHGAGLEAEAYNRALYEAKGKQFLIEQKLFPVLQFEYAF